MARVLIQQLAGPALQNSIPQPLYDTTQIGTTASGEQFLFQNPAGATGISGSGTKTLADTNMTMNGQLSAGDAFAIRGYGINPLCRDTAAAGLVASSLSLQDISDFRRFLAQTIFRFQTGSDGRKCIEVHADQLPAGVGLEGVVATGGTTTAGQNMAYITGNGVRQADNRFSLGANFAEYVRAGENFRGSLFWPASLSFSNTFNVRVLLSGIWFQAISVGGAPVPVSA